MQYPAAARAIRPLPVVAVVVVIALSTACSIVEPESSDGAVLRSEAAVAGQPAGDSAAPVADDPAGAGAEAGRPGDVAPAPGSSDPDPELSPDPDAVYPAGTCYERAGGAGGAEQVGCGEPHSIEVYATGDLPGGPGAPYRGLDAAIELCDAEFRRLTGIGLGLATVFDRSVLRPSEATWDEGERDVTCYVVYPEPTERPLAEIDPVRSFGRVSVFGLDIGDCLADFDETATWFEAVPCTQPHEAEIFVAERYPDGPFPGPTELDATADELCFGPSFEDFDGRDYASSSVFSLVSVPTDETWEQGDRTINCILTDDLVRSGSFRDSGL